MQMPDIYVHQKRGYVLSSPKVFSQAYNNLVTQTKHRHTKSIYPMPSLRSGNKRVEERVFSSPEQTTAK
jgi:hypothetical protein